MQSGAIQCCQSLFKSVISCPSVELGQIHVTGRLTNLQGLFIRIFKITGDDLEVILVTLIDNVKAAHVAVTCV